MVGPGEISGAELVEGMGGELELGDASGHDVGRRRETSEGSAAGPTGTGFLLLYFLFFCRPIKRELD